jgi:hypothetical protein
VSCQCIIELLVVPPFCAQYVSQRFADQGIVGIEFQGGSQMRLSLLDISQRGKNEAEIAMSFGVLGI